MIEPNEVTAHAQKLKQEADALLRETKLKELLSEFGETKLDGSYAYDLLVDHDLDFGVIVKEMTLGIRSSIVSVFAKQNWVYSVNMTDRINFEPLSNLQAPRGLYVGLTVPFSSERWNIDIWFVVANELPTDQLAGRVFQSTAEQKAVMLTIKYELMKMVRKQKGITSAEVYEAVLSENIKTTSEFLQL